MKKIIVCCLGAAMLLGGCAFRQGEGNVPAGREDAAGPADDFPEPSAGPADEESGGLTAGASKPAEKDGQNADSSLGLPREWFLEETVRYASQMAKGNFSVTEDFADSLLTQLSGEELAAAWEQTVEGLGELTGAEPGEVVFTGESAEKDGIIENFDGYLVATASIWYEKQGVTLTVAYNPFCRIEGIYLTYLPLPKGPEDKDAGKDEASCPKVTEDYAEVEVSIGSGEYPLDGLLTLPKGVECPPVVVLVQGSGQSDLDETIGAAGNAPFADLAHGLAEQGIATLRYNKRFFQYPELATEKITIYDEVLDDVSEALAFLAGKADVKQIYILGHSLGGMLAPFIAQENGQVAGIISLAGSPRKMWEIIYDQNMAAIASAGLGDAEAESLRELIEAEYQKVLAIAELAGEEGDGKEADLSEAVFGVSGWYWASLAGIDAGEIAQGLEIPMLFLQGSEDFQVYAEVDFAAWQQILEGKENVEFALFEGLNHLFMESDGTKSIAEYDIKAHVADAVVLKIADWIREENGQH